ncbi:class I SAM-dependent methyltransferase [Hansschlegelia zhihuaiae]|nr:class I SAM-dependent methyltransferase [Hansschlegelia zhihuaiae]
MSEDFRSRYEAVRERAFEFEGMTGELSVAIFLALLDLQRENGVTGHFAEFGVYQGRSAAIVLGDVGESETLALVDWSAHPKLDRLAAISTRFRMFKGSSEKMSTDKDLLSLLDAGVRFSHHDASHSFSNVATEMALMENRIRPRGLMVLDDYGSIAYMQVIAACFHHLYTKDSQLEILLHADNKAYLCRRADFPFYAPFVLERLPALLRGAGLDCYLARTENDSRYRGFSLARKRAPTDPDLYGLNIWGDQFYKL